MRLFNRAVFSWDEGTIELGSGKSGDPVDRLQEEIRYLELKR